MLSPSIPSGSLYLHHYVFCFSFLDSKFINFCNFFPFYCWNIRFSSYIPIISMLFRFLKWSTIYFNTFAEWRYLLHFHFPQSPSISSSIGVSTISYFRYCLGFLILFLIIYNISSKRSTQLLNFSSVFPLIPLSLFFTYSITFCVVFLVFSTLA